MNLVSPSLNSLCMQPDVNSNNSEELVKSSEETLRLTLDKQYQGKNQADNDVIKGRLTGSLLLKWCNSS